MTSLKELHSQLEKAQSAYDADCRRFRRGLDTFSESVARSLRYRRFIDDTRPIREGVRLEVDRLKANGEL